MAAKPEAKANPYFPFSRAEIELSSALRVGLCVLPYS